jgi:TRAP-type C4-dicarboxylate transport system permease small subunit
VLKKIGVVLDRVAYVSGYISGWVLLGMTLVIIIEVISRYAMHRPLILADEMSAYGLVFISLVGLAYTMSVRGHIRINFVVNMMRPRFRSWLRVGTLSLFLAYSLTATIVSYQLVIQAFTRGMMSNTIIQTPWWIPMSGIPIGFTLLTLSLIAEVIRRIADVRAGIDIESHTVEEEVGRGSV